MSTELKKLLKRLSKNARRSLQYADKIAKDMGDKDISALHIFLGVLLNSPSLGSRTLIAMGVDIKESLTSFAGNRQFDFTGISTSKKVDLYLSGEAKNILRMSYATASKMSHVYVGTEHLVLAILQLKDSAFTKHLAKAGMTEIFFKENLLKFAVYPPGVLSKAGKEMSNPQGETPLSILGEDLVESAKRGFFDPLVGRKEELQKVINVLSRRRKNNPIIVGESGVGKTALVEGLAQLIAAGQVPNSLEGRRLIELDIPAVVASSKLRGDIEEKIIGIINEVVQSPDVILFIDEVHNIMGSGIPGVGMDIASVLKPALDRDDFKVIGATTNAEYTKFFEVDNALVRRFQPIQLDEPSIEDTVEILHRVEPILERHHNVDITVDAIEAAAKLSDRYVTDRFLPDKAIDLLDEAAASKRLALEWRYKDVSELIRKRDKAVAKKEDAVLLGNMKLARDLDVEVDGYENEIKDIEQKRSRSRKSKRYTVGVGVVQDVVSSWTGIPISTITSRESDVLLDLVKLLGRKVVGQDEAVNVVSSAIKRARTGISAGDRPWASLLFLGPTGVGKTELAKVLTEVLFGDEDRLVQIDMSEMMEMHSVSKLIGSPPGYVGYKEGGQLTETVRKRPHSVILFDEIEKAHPDVLNVLLQIMEYGHLTDGKGRKVNFKNTVVILTSNIGAEEIRKDKILGFSSDVAVDKRTDEDIEYAYDDMRDDLMKELKDTLRPELLNRIDDIVIFRSLTRGDAKQIVNILLEDLNVRLQDQGLEVSLSKKLLEDLVKDGFSEEYGARPLRRELQDVVESAVADYILKKRSRNSNGSVEKLTVSKDKAGKVVVKS